MNQPVSVIVERKVLPEKKAECEDILKDIVQEASQFDGYLGTNVVNQNESVDNLYQIIFRFDSQESLDEWMSSEKRLKYIRKLDELMKVPAAYQFITGLETWFSLPGKDNFTPPPRYKMAVVTWCAITPLLILYNYLAGPFIKDFPLVLKISMTTPIIVLIMTYLWMPLMVKVFRRWLYPSNPSQ